MSTNSSPSTPDIITRIAKVYLHNYRGFKSSRNDKPFCLDTDADLVLLTGPNGYGKSSFLEALLLLLTGWYGNRDPVKHLLSQRSASLGESDTQPYESCSIKAKVQGGSELHLEWSKEHQGSLPMPQGLESQLAGVDPQDPKQRELDARLCGFFQDRLDYLFDEGASGRTLRDVFEPLPPGLKKVIKELPNVKEELQKKIQELEGTWNGRPLEELDKNLNEVYQAFRPIYLELAQGAGSWPGESATPLTIATNSELDEFARQVLKAAGYPASEGNANLRKYFRDALGKQVEDQIEVAKRRAQGATRETEELREKIQNIEQQINEIRQTYPTLEQDIKVFDAEDPELPDVLSIFQALAANAQRWSQVLVPAGEPQDVLRFQRVLEEMAAVREEEAGKCAGAIAVWLKPRRTAYDRQQVLEAERAKLGEQIQESFREVSKLRDLQRNLNLNLDVLLGAWEERHRYTEWHSDESNRRRREAHDYLENACQAIEWHKKEIDEISKPSAELLEALRERAQTILGRFSLVDGFLPLKLVPEDIDIEDSKQDRRIYVIKTADGRTLQHLSTGQRAQVAVSLLTAQNLAVPDKLAHRIILLDDVTTAYDLSNLTREAIVWRQLAYSNEDEQQRRQIFVSSHHEDMTNHLLDLLVPPGKKEMRLIRFKDWNPDTGPIIEQFRVTPTGGGNDAAQAKENLQTDLSSF